MQIKEIKIKFGMTQNLGDYTNCRPEIELSATVESGDNIDDVISELDELAKTHLHKTIDDELELSGQVVKYHNGKLFNVSRNIARKCIAIYQVGTKLPDESTWKTKDYWQNEHYNYGFPNKMRGETAIKLMEKLMSDNHGYQVATVPYDMIPPMPDDGEEPEWHKKDLGSYLSGYLSIPEEYWVEIGELEHVTKDYLKELYNNNVEHLLLQDRLNIIRSNKVSRDKNFDESNDEEIPF